MKDAQAGVKPTSKALGLRERKKQKTREAIQRAAMRLFLKQGYDETTIEEIAEAVEISPSTFFNYFPTKEEVVMLDIYDPIAISMFRESPKDEAVSVTFRRALDALAEILEQDRELILTRGRLLFEVPALRGRIGDEMERTQDVMVALLAERTGRNTQDFELRVTVRVLIAATYEASLRWMTSRGQEPLRDLLNRAMDVVEGGARLDALPLS
jgi:AcrR family transcriptional regulator